MTDTPPAQQSNAADALSAPQQTDPAELQKKVAELEERNAAYRKGVDQYSTEKKNYEAELARLRVLAGEKSEEKPPEQNQTLTRDEFQKELSKRDFEQRNESNFKLLNEEGKTLYQDKLSKGVDPQEALDLALFRSGVQRSASTIQGVSSPSHGVDRTGGDTQGVSQEMIAYYKRSYPTMKDEEIAAVIRNAQKKNPNDYRPAW